MDARVGLDSFQSGWDIAKGQLRKTNASVCQCPETMEFLYTSSEQGPRFQYPTLNCILP